MSAPTTTQAWSVTNTSGGFDALSYNEQASIPELGVHDVLVKLHAASLNYRDLIIPKGMYPFPLNIPVVPGSDGSGEVLSIGKNVTRFQPGDKVVTLFNQGHLAGSLDGNSIKTGLGGVLDGTLRAHGVFNEQGLVKAPTSLSHEEASTLSCAALTAWNALYGLEGKPLKQGQVVVTQGTGGVSMFAAQFAIAAGATVIATTSSAAKADKLKQLGVHHIINYKETPNWGEIAKSLTPDSVGADFVVEVGGPTTMAQSFKAIRIDGVIGIIGFVGGPSKDSQPSFLDVLNNLCTVRGVLVGSRAQFEDMNRAIDANGIKPVVDGEIFELSKLKEAYQYMWEQKHFGKLVVKIP